MSRGFRLRILGISLFASIVALISEQSPPPLMPFIMNDFVISHTQAALSMTLFDLPALFSIPLGILSDRHGKKGLGTISILLVGLGSLVVATSHSLAVMLIGRLAGGIGSAWTAIVTLAIVSQWLPGAETGAAMSVYGLGLPIATVTAFNALGRVGIAYGWRFAFYLVAVNSFIVVVLFLRFIRGAPCVRLSAHKGSAIYVGSSRWFVNRALWKLSIYWLFFNAAWYSFAAWAPTLLSEYTRIPLASTGTLSSVPMIACLPCMPLFGLVSNRLKSAGAVILVLGPGLMTVCLIILPFVRSVTPDFVAAVIGVGFSVVPPIVFRMAGDILGPNLAGSSFGVLNSCGGVGSAIGPVLVGITLDLGAAPIWGFTVAIVIEMLCVISALALCFSGVT